MIKCLCCGKLFDDVDSLHTYSECVGEFWGQPAYQEFATCPACGDSEFDWEYRPTYSVILLCTGEVMDTAFSIEDGIFMISGYESDDAMEGIYKPNAYDLVDDEGRSVL